MKKTLLRIVQDILYDMDSDEVNSISDNVEATQVARKVENVYWDLVARLNLPERKTFYELDPSNDIDLPVVMYRPEFATSLDFLRYDKAGDGEPAHYEDIIQLSLNVFLNVVYAMDRNSTETGSYELEIGAQTFTFYYKNNAYPKYFTAIDDRILLFDAFHEDIDDTLVSNKTMAFGSTLPTFTQDDSFVPDLDAEQFVLLYQEAKKACFVDMKQQDNGDAVQRSRKQWIRSQASKKAVVTDPYAELHKLPNYGRKKR